METKQIMSLALAIAIGALVFSAALIPAISMATDTEDTFTNEGYYTMDKVASDSDFVLTMNYGSPIIDISGKTIDMSQAGLTTGKAYTIMGGDNFVLRYMPATTPYVQYFGDQSVTPTFLTAVSAGSKVTVTVSDGSIVFASTDTSYSTPATLTLSENTYCINPEGKGAYTMKKADNTAYIVKDTDIIVLDGITSLATTDVGIFATGTIDGDLDASTFRGTTTYDVSFRDFEYTTTAVNGYEDLVKLEKVEFVATQNSTDYDVTYSYFIVPTEVTAELSIHADSTTRAILNMIPIIAVLGLLIGIVTVGYMKFRN